MSESHFLSLCCCNLNIYLVILSIYLVLWVCLVILCNENIPGSVIGFLECVYCNHLVRIILPLISPYCTRKQTYKQTDDFSVWNEGISVCLLVWLWENRSLHCGQVTTAFPPTLLPVHEKVYIHTVAKVVSAYPAFLWMILIIIGLSTVTEQTYSPYVHTKMKYLSTIQIIKLLLSNT